MSLAEKQALALRDGAVSVVMAKGTVTASDLYSYHDARIRIDLGDLPAAGKSKSPVKAASRTH
jgi:hypothetical protein